MNHPRFQKRSHSVLLSSSIVRIELGHGALLVNGRSGSAQRRWEEAHSESALLHPLCAVCHQPVGDPIGVDLNKQATVTRAQAIAHALGYYHPCKNAEVILVIGATGDELLSTSDAILWVTKRHPLADPEVLSWIQGWLWSVKHDLAEEYGIAAEIDPQLMAARELP